MAPAQLRPLPQLPHAAQIELKQVAQADQGPRERCRSIAEHDVMADLDDLEVADGVLEIWQVGY